MKETTFRQFSKHLPMSIAVRYRNNIKLDRGESVLDYVHEAIFVEDSLWFLCAFDWDISKEGREYWSSLSNLWPDIELFMQSDIYTKVERIKKSLANLPIAIIAGEEL